MDISIVDQVVQDGEKSTLTPVLASGDNNEDGVLDVGETWTYTAAFTAEQSHIDNGNDIVNTFTFNATELGDPASDDATTTVTQAPSVTVSKSVGEPSIGAP